MKEKKIHKTPARLIHCNGDPDLIQTMHNALTSNNRWLLWAAFSYLGIFSNDYSCKQAFCLKLITELFWLLCWFQLWWEIVHAYCGRKSLRKVGTNSPFQKALGTELLLSISETLVRDRTVSVQSSSTWLAVKTQGGSLCGMTFATIKKSLQYKTGLSWKHLDEGEITINCSAISFNGKREIKLTTQIGCQGC